MNNLFNSQDGEEDTLEVIETETSLSAELDDEGNPIEVAAEDDDEDDAGEED